jgi:hypothetical protein
VDGSPIVEQAVGAPNALSANAVIGGSFFSSRLVRTMSLQARAQATTEYQKLQTDLQNAVDARQRLESQLQENEMVKKVGPNKICPFRPPDPLEFAGVHTLNVKQYCI